jgi:hypothetical protein
VSTFDNLGCKLSTKNKLLVTRVTIGNPALPRPLHPPRNGRNYRPLRPLHIRTKMTFFMTIQVLKNYTSVVIVLLKKASIDDEPLLASKGLKPLGRPFFAFFAGGGVSSAIVAAIVEAIVGGVSNLG